MITYTTARPVDLAQLAVELGTTDLSMRDDGTERTITVHDETITQAQLETAVEAHVPAPPPLSDTARLQHQINELTDLLLFGGF